jgi:pyrimidine 5'-nucleotidase
MKTEMIFFDLDATLYPAGNGVWEMIKDRIHQYMIETVNVPEEDVPDLRLKYLSKYGTSLVGLMKNYDVDPEHYLEYVHDIPISDYIRPDPKLRRILESLPYPLWVFTNSDYPHASRVLKALGVDDLFAGITDMFAMDFELKPNPSAYRVTLELAGEPDPNRCVFFDDIPANLITGKKFGFTTVLVGGENNHPEIDYHLKNIHQIPQKLSFL